MRLSLLLVVAMAAAAQPAEEKFAVSGTVTNSLTGEPLRRALVTITCMPAPGGAGPQQRIQMPEQHRALTDAAGRYTFDGLPAGACSLGPQKPSFRFSVEGQTVTLGPSRENVALKLDPLPTVTGSVKDDRGEPWPGVQVEGVQVRYPQGRREVRRLVHVYTDDRGRFYFYEMPPGTYYFRVAGRADYTSAYVGERRDTDLSYESFRPVWHGGGQNLESATPVRLEAGQNATLDFTLPIRRGYAVRGFISNLEQYKPVKLELLQGEEPLAFGFVSVNAATGQFQAYGVADGMYTIRAVQGDARAEAPLRVAGGDVSGVSLELAPPVKVQATLRWEGPEPEPMRLPDGRQLRLGRGAQLLLLPVEAIQPREARPPLSASMAKDGSLAIERVPVGRYRLEISGGNVQSILLGQTALHNGGVLDVPVAGLPAPLEIVLRSAQGSVQARSESDGCHAVLLPESGPPPPKAIKLRSFPQSVPPGDYRPWSWCGDDEWEYANPEQLRLRATSGERVQVTEQGTVEVVIKGKSK